jgi:hypothetical protein
MPRRQTRPSEGPCVNGGGSSEQRSLDRRTPFRLLGHRWPVDRMAHRKAPGFPFGSALAGELPVDEDGERGRFVDSDHRAVRSRGMTDDRRVAEFPEVVGRLSSVP